MRRAMLFVAFVAAAVVMVAWPTSRAPRGEPDRSSAPTAAEEGDVGEVGSGPPQAQESGPVATSTAPQPAAPRPAVQDSPSAPPVLPLGGVSVPSGKREIIEREDALAQSSSSEPQRVATTAVPQVGSGRSPVFTPPVLLTPVAGYPAEAYRVVLDRSVLTPQLRVEGAQGRVVLRILVRPDGSIAQVAIAESSGSPVLDEAAVRAAAEWVFVPATRDSQPMEAWAIVPIRFVVP